VRLGINARFLAAPTGGVQRFARETTERLLELCSVTLYVPAGVAVPAAWRSRAKVVVGRLRGHAWEQLELPRAQATDLLFNPANTSPLRQRSPYVLMLHDVLPLVHPEWYGRAFAAWYRALVPPTARRAAQVLTTSGHSARTIAATLGVDPERITIVPQGLAPFDRPAAAETSKRALAGLGVTQPFVLALGAGDARKQAAYAEVVLDEYNRRFGERPRLVMVGGTSRRVHGRPAAATAGGPGYVTDEQLHAFYTCATAVLSPSLAEGFGRVPLEAMCCGTPCLVAERPGAEETLSDTPAQVLPLSAAAWASALHAIMVAGERVPPAVAGRLRQRWTWAAAAAAVHAACNSAYDASGLRNGRAAAV
jgi:glycosyltransferase involved in cell wall biosynthesis